MSKYGVNKAWLRELRQFAQRQKHEEEALIRRYFKENAAYIKEQDRLKV